MSGELAGRGVGAGTIFALVAPPGVGFLVAWLALRSLGACVLLVDHALTESELEDVLEHMGAGFCWRSGDDWSPGREIPLRRTPGRGDRLPRAAVIKLSSGSGGRPVGIAVGGEQLAVDGRKLAASMGLRPDDRFLGVVPFSHSYGFSLLPTSLFALGAPLVLPAPDEDPLDAARELGATVLPSVPAWYRARLRGGRDTACPPSLRLFLSAGAPLPPSVARGWRERTGRPIHVLYGSSECGGITYDRLGDAAERGVVGTPVDGVRLVLEPTGLDGRRRIVVHSAAVALGYVPEDDARAGRIRNGSFRTDDLGELQGNELRLLGRCNGWINVNGKKVDPSEVEGVIGALRGVEEVAVLGKPLADGREVVRAVVAARDGAVGFRDVTTWCRGRLAPYKIPRSVVVVDELPRTARGKLDRRALLGL